MEDQQGTITDDQLEASWEEADASIAAVENKSTKSSTHAVYVMQS